MTPVALDPFDRRPIPRPGDTVAQVVVVCRANICRSPLAMVLLEAEARARHGAPLEVWVRSAGTHAREGLVAASESRFQARRRGLELDAHRSARLTRMDVAEADLVLTMSEDQRDAAARLHPPAAGWVFTLPELARLAGHVDLDGLADLVTRQRLRTAVEWAARARPRVARPPAPEDIADPYGGPGAGYATMAEQVEQLVDAVSGLLFGDGGAHR